ncbi:zinc-binding dehydrogenase [Bailinhaonella thermotolerans]|uniref:Alcohol dehydrogenase n=1 Tax=Bailinhaonella thermotolerans TaxID=1070861 RepID=A0A3A4AI27_9ACTN|nr:zinc-binding dehydrogenase [Bailinhaonella thermotolerans]RJL26644.1 alcohol dehydrogenase [Bailinhaonella thermotolerans]
MRALIHDPAAPSGLRLGEAPDPVPGDGQALIEVSAISLNYGELYYLGGTQPGTVPGWDAAGVVRQAAAEGSGPAAGTRVVTFGWTGAWGALRAVDTDQLAVVPDSVDLGTASALPVAGVTALQALRALGSVVGRRVLITGASGGVGRFAVQLAARAGAHVIASVGGEKRGEGLRELGADEVVIGLEGVTEPVYGVLDNVGGPQLADVIGLLEEGGAIEWIGTAAGGAAPLAQAQRDRRWRLSNFHVHMPIGGDLAHLVALVESGALDAQVDWRTPWDRAPEAAEALLSRRIRGKAVLDVTP